jgi:6-phosphogluconolactonase
MTISRRRFLASSLASGLYAGGLQAQSGFFPHPHKKVVPAVPLFVYFGTDTTKPGAQGIYLSRFDPATGKLTMPTVAAKSLRPAFFAVGQGRGKKVLYVCNEGDEHTSAISYFVIDPATGALRPFGQVSSGGMGPCYMSLDADGQSAYVANYSGSAVASYAVKPDGSLSEPVEKLDFKDAKFGHTGPNKDRQLASHRTVDLYGRRTG